MTRLLDLWSFHRRSGLITIGMFVGLLAFLAIVAVFVRVTGPGDSAAPAVRQSSTAGRSSTSAAVSMPSALASDVAEWDAKPAIVPATSSAFPAVPSASHTDPGAYARAFATELFTRNYQRSSRDELLAWAQYENAPLRSPKYPEADWSKVLVNSLTDLTWDDATETPVPTAAGWLAQAQSSVASRVSDVVARVDPQWEQQVVDGYEPADRLMTVWDVSLRVTESTSSGVIESYDVALAIQLGTSPRQSYGVAATNNYVVRKVS